MLLLVMAMIGNIAVVMLSLSQLYKTARTREVRTLFLNREKVRNVFKHPTRILSIFLKPGRAYS